MAGPWHDLAPSLARQRPIDDRVVDRAAHGCFVGGLHRGDHQHASGFGLLEKGMQQLFLSLDREVLAMTTAGRLTPQDRLPVTKVIRMHLSHRTDLPAEGEGTLCGSETQGRPQPHALNPLVLRLVFGFFQQRCQTLGSSFRQRLWVRIRAPS